MLVQNSSTRYGPIHYNLIPSVSGRDAGRDPIEPVLQRIDPLLTNPVTLTDDEFQWLMDFVPNGLHDPNATPERLRQLIPDRLQSGRLAHIFE